MRTSHHSDNTGSGDAFVHVKTKRFKAIGHDSGRAMFLKSELRMHVEIASY
jgi:hypothetical protein